MKSKQGSSERIDGNVELLLRAFQSHSIGKQAMMKSEPGSGKRQERNFKIVVNHITINEDQLPQVSRQSMATLKDVFGHNIKKYSGTLHHKPGNEHLHFLVMSGAPKTYSAVKARIVDSMALIFGTERGLVEAKMFNELNPKAGPAHGLKGLGDYRSLYVNNNDHPNHRPRMLSTGQWGSCAVESGTWRQKWFWPARPSAGGHSSHQGRNSRI